MRKYQQNNAILNDRLIKMLDIKDRYTETKDVDLINKFKKTINLYRFLV